MAKNYEPKKKRIRDDILFLVTIAVKFRDKFTCKHCRKKVSGNNCHPSHIIPQSADKRLALYPENIKVLCFHCHINRRHKYPTESGKWYASAYPKNLAFLENEHCLNVGKFTITLDEYGLFAKRALDEINKFDYQVSDELTDSQKNRVRLAINRLNRFIEYVNE